MSSTEPSTEQLYLDDAYAKQMDASVVEVRDDGAVALDRTIFYATGGGQPNDTGTLRATVDGSDSGEAFRVSSVRKEGALIWHTLTSGSSDGEPADPAQVAQALAVGTAVSGTLDWERRHQLMRTHTALHILCGVIWNEWSVFVTGGNMEPLKARMDFEFGPLPDNFAEHVSTLVNAEIAADRPIEVSYIDRDLALEDEELIRTKVSLVPESVKRLRVVDIVGLDKQADGGTHVASTSEVGRFEITKTESKGKGNKRVRMVLGD